MKTLSLFVFVALLVAPLAAVDGKGMKEMRRWLDKGWKKACP